jgi:hypothetical protein
MTLVFSIFQWKGGFYQEGLMGMRFVVFFVSSMDERAVPSKIATAPTVWMRETRSCRTTIVQSTPMGSSTEVSIPVQPEEICVSYSGSYRTAVTELLKTLEFRSNNQNHQPIVEAIELIRKYAGATTINYALDDDVPTGKDIIPVKWGSTTCPSS